MVKLLHMKVIQWHCLAATSQHDSDTRIVHKQPPPFGKLFMGMCLETATSKCSQLISMHQSEP